MDKCALCELLFSLIAGLRVSDIKAFKIEDWSQTFKKDYYTKEKP